jgi:hypothetical protein
MTDTWRFRIWLIACGVLGLFLSTHAWGKSAALAAIPLVGSTLILILPSIGQALVIAPVTACVVDAAAKRQFMAEFARDVSIHIVGRLLPEHLREHMLGYLNLTMVRKDWKLTFTLADWPDHPEFVQLTTISEYEIENRGEAGRPYEFFYEVNKSWFPEIAEGRLLHVCISVAGEKTFEADEQSLQGMLAAEPDCSLFHKTVEIPGRPHSVYRFLAESVECFRDGFSPFVAPVATLGVTVTAYFPKDKFRVAMYASTRPSSRSLETTELSNGTQWHISEPLLPGQCVFTRWERIGNETEPIRAMVISQIKSQGGMEHTMNQQDLIVPGKKAYDALRASVPKNAAQPACSCINSPLVSTERQSSGSFIEQTQSDEHEDSAAAVKAI